MRLPCWFPVLLLSCGGARPPAAHVAAPAPTLTATPLAASKRALLSHEVSREDVLRVVDKSPALFLSHVRTEDWPVFRKGKFYGFRIASLDKDMFRGVDLRAGDVVVRVNGLPIEKPEDLSRTFDNLKIAKTLHVDYEREGNMRALHYEIVDDE